MNPKVFQEQVVIVTGAGRGIGRTIAELYGSHGAKVILAEVDPTLGERAEAELKAQGICALCIATDVSKPEQIERLFAKVDQHYGKLDVLVNNAGISSFSPFFELTVEGWDQILNTNLRSVFLCSQAAAKIMRQRSQGSILNIASTRALMSEANTEAYAASKGGIVALTHALAASLASLGISVNAISPGWIHTRPEEELRDADHKQHWSGRVGQAVDIANACLFLSHPENRFINGTNLVVDGGMTKKMMYVP